jgi:hypothetical protein
VSRTAVVIHNKTDFSLAHSMALSTPSVRVVTGVDTIPAKDEPDESRVASWIVDSTSAGRIMTAAAS